MNNTDSTEDQLVEEWPKLPIELKQLDSHCSYCGKPKNNNNDKKKELLKCGRCKQAYYHNKECQRKHWVEQHKNQCKKWMIKVQEQKQHELKVRVVETIDKGRVVIAKQNYEPGDIVIRESPAVLFDTRNEYMGLLEAFDYPSCSRSTQSQILQLFAPPLREIDSTQRRQRHVRLENQRQLYLQQKQQQQQQRSNSSSHNNNNIMTTIVTQKLLAIIETNAHQLFNANFEKNTDNATNDPNPKNYMGLFILGSMLEHSCCPNLTMNTTHDGKLELIAETVIAIGERLSFSYIEGIFEKSQQQRRHELLAEKHFYCICERCCNIDDCRPIIPPPPPQPIFWNPNQQSYVCLPIISSTNDHYTKMEMEIVNRFQQLERQLEEGTTTNGGDFLQHVLNQLSSLITSSNWKSYIHPLHYINVSAYQLVSTTSAAMARIQLQQQQQNNMPATTTTTRCFQLSLLRLSVLALLHNILWTELMVSFLRKRQQQQQQQQQLKQQQDNRSDNDNNNRSNNNNQDLSKLLFLLNTKNQNHGENNDNNDDDDDDENVGTKKKNKNKNDITSTTTKSFQLVTKSLQSSLTTLIATTTTKNNNNNNNDTMVVVVSPTQIREVLEAICCGCGNDDDDHNQSSLILPVNDDDDDAHAQQATTTTTTQQQQHMNISSVTADALLTAYYAGQDLILSDHIDLCYLLYSKYHSWFHKLKQPNDENRKKIDILVTSKGKINPFF